MALTDFKERIGKLQSFDFGAELEIIVSENVERLPDLIRKQLEEGLSGDGKPSTIFGSTTYSPLTVEIKQSEGIGLGGVTDRITNYMTGAFYESIRMVMDGQLLDADSDVSYFGDIRLYSSEALLEVSPENRLEFAETITMPAIKAALLSKAGIKVI